MSYCVNCGVELDKSAKVCPLCNTPVINPAELEKLKGANGPFPKSKGEVERVKRKDLGVFFSVVLLSIAFTCGILNALVFKGAPWSLAVIGVCAVFWVLLIPAVIFTKQSPYLYVFLDGTAIAAYLYLLTFLTAGDAWFLGLGLPIVVLIILILEIFILCVRRLPRSFLTVALYLCTAAGLLCLGLEILIDRFCGGHIALSWSAVVLTVCAVFNVAIITLLSRRRLRNEVRRRLHF